MSLSCGCGEWDGEGWSYSYCNDLTELKTKRRRRCKSCAKLIDIGSDCLEFNRFQYPQDEIKARIFGEDYEMPLASWFMCKYCGEIYLNLTDIGYCLQIDENMNDDLAEYHKMTGFVPKDKSYNYWGDDKNLKEHHEFSEG